ncbi:MAG: T9SS type A sorting domain-containing protein [Bacteroidetes bacterium]|nr:T9SS type A sorting domain-containing protein [Bacteroidota bacterium]
MLSIQIYSSFGERVATIAEIETDGEQHFEFDASMLSSGIYFCRISTDTKTDFYKIMVVK